MTTVHVENQRYGGRTLIGYTEEGEHVAGWPEVASEALRAINHLTGHTPIPAPTAYRILGDLKGAGHQLPQALEQLCRGLQASLAAYDVYDHRRDPAASVSDAIALLARAARKVRRPTSDSSLRTPKPPSGIRATTSTTSSQTPHSCLAPGDTVMDAGTISSPTPDLRLRLLKAAVVVPDLIISGLIAFVLLAALPADVAVGFFTGMLVISIVVASGRAEGLAVRILHAARRPTALEALRLAGPLRLVADRSGLAGLRVLIGRGGEPVTAAGCQHLILHREVMDAHLACRITNADVAALVAHGVGRLQLGQPRLDLLVTLWTMPWDFIRGLVVGVGRQLSWVPLGPLAWQTRFVVGTIAVVLETQAGRWPSPFVIAVFLALTYLTPRCRHAWHRHICQEADRRAEGLAPAGAGSGFPRLPLSPLQRSPRAPSKKERFRLSLTPPPDSDVDVNVFALRKAHPPRQLIERLRALGQREAEARAALRAYQIDLE